MSDVLPPKDATWRAYMLLALFDRRRPGIWLDDAVRAAREGMERETMGEPGAWDEFDALWDARTLKERLILAEAGR